MISALAEVEILRKAVVGKDAEISHKDALLSLKDAEIKKLSDTLLWLRRKVFGKMSEKNLPLYPDQLLLFEQEHLTDEERARLDEEVEAAEQQMTKTITVKVKPAREILGAYKGSVQCDGYDAYDQFEKNDNITVYGCWAHARRKFVDALNESNRLATEALCFIRKIYKVESDAYKAGLNADECKEQRLKISYPTIRIFETWMKETYLKVLPNSKMGDAIEYTYSLLPSLSHYVNDGRINIDNNLIENAIRPLALGRKNYLFCGNDASAYRAAIVYSLISTCKAVYVDPRT